LDVSAAGSVTSGASAAADAAAPMFSTKRFVSASRFDSLGDEEEGEEDELAVF
jgi:hypothetical protein